MRVLILANGDPPSPELAQHVAGEADLRIVTDGAAHKAAQLGIVPDVLCGDFDFVDLEAAQRAFPAVTVVPTPDQEFADLEKALILARERGATSIAILGALGGRMDHTLSSFALVQQYAPFLPARLLDERGVTWAMMGKCRQSITANSGDTISLVTFTGATVSIEGVHWPLEHFALRPGTHGVSNVAAQSQVVVTVEIGSVFITHLTLSPQPFVK